MTGTKDEEAVIRNFVKIIVKQFFDVIWSLGPSHRDKFHAMLVVNN